MKRQVMMFPLVLWVTAMLLHAQQEGNIWITVNVGIDFNTTPPTTFPGLSEPTDVGEGIASIADRSGKQWLFYTNGQEVWNRNRTTMPNANWAAGRLLGHTSTSQSALILPDPADTMLYYIFTADWQPDYDDSVGVGQRGVNYSVVDMRRDGGLGDVVQKNIPLFKPAAEKLAATQDCTGKGYWMLAHGWNDDRYYAYHVSDTGIAGPVISRTGVNHEYRNKKTDNARGYLKISPNGKKLAAAIMQDGTVELADFDNTTGVVSNSQLIPIGQQTFGLSFSPNSSKLYVIRLYDENFRDSLFQFDLNAPDFLSTKTLIAIYDVFHKTGGFYCLQIAPNGMIVVGGPGHYLAMLERPDEPGSQCRYVERWLDLKGASAVTLPNLVDSWYDPNPIRCLPPQAQLAISDSVLCLGGCFRLQDTSRPSAAFGPSSGRLWRFPGANPDTSTLPIPPPLCYDSPGTYTVELVVFNEFGTDTARATLRVVAPPTVNAGRDTAICPGDTLQLQGSGSGTLTWAFTNDLSCWNCADPIAVPRQSASYILTARNSNGCVSHDTIAVTVADSGSLRVDPVESICAGESVTLRGVVSDGSRLLGWTPSVGLSCDTCAATQATPSATTLYHLRAVTACGAPLVDSVLVVVHPQPNLRLAMQGKPVLCAGESITLMATADSGKVQWTPSTGLSCDTCRTTTASPTQTTTYTATVRTPNGCTARDSITVQVALPLAAVASGDTAMCGGGVAQLGISSNAAGARVRWTPSTGLSCDSCAAPTASPAATTTYRVRVESQEGCWVEDSVTVKITPAEQREFSIGRDYRVGVGGTSEVSIVTRGTSSSMIAGIELVMEWNPRVVRLAKEWGTEGAAIGQATIGWSLTVSSDSLGKVRMLLVPPGGQGLLGSGEVARLKFGGFVGDSAVSELRLSGSVEPMECRKVEWIPGRIGVDSICGLSNRLMEVGASGYALHPNHPNPFNPTTEIEFELGLSGWTEVEISDSRGLVVERLFAGELGEGEHRMVWDANGVSSGVYYCRIRSGSWQAEQLLIVVK
ncbi:MAG: hypothetical protein K1X90_00855 [Candidatus Kapabacteria bacterium]|nr:hypothetical protein [Candidatus Kapabacteria bacterium]